MDISLLLKIIIVAGACIIGVGSVFIGKYKGQQDNPIEEKAEEVIKDQTGVDIDLTPSSKEKDK